jgi:CHAD domain-containing protein
MRRVTRTLGDARDADVQIDFLEKFLDSLEESRYHAGIKRLLLRIRQKREGLQRKVIKVMDRLEASGVLENIEETLRQIRIHGRLNKVDVHTSLVYQQACSQGSPRRNGFGSEASPTPKAYGLAISLKLDEMLAYEPYVRQPERVEELHAMRIAAKRLRYTIEVFEPLYHEELKSSRQVVREAQTILGDIHDYDVWVEYLPQFLEEERVRTLEYFGHTRPLNLLKAGILYLQQDCQQRRDQRYKEFVKFWEELQHQAVWENLEQILHARLEKINGKK